jgi:enoyl-CoA hydratase/carnithine racemase
VVRSGVPLERIEVHDKKDGVLLRLNLHQVQVKYRHTTVSIHRAALHRILLEHVWPGTFHLGKRCTGLTQARDGVTVQFQDGTQVKGDVLVGADGIHSVIRRALFPDVALRYSGQTCYRGIATMELPPSLARTCWEVWGGASRFGFSALGSQQVYWFAPMTAPAGRAEREGTLSEQLAERYAGFPAPIPAIIERTPMDEIIRIVAREGIFTPKRKRLVMKLETMYFEKQGRIGSLTLNRPQLLNAMNYQGSLDLNRAAEMIRDDPDVRLVLIRGAGRAFCTGIDLKQLAAGEIPHQYYENWDRALRILEQAEKILICAMHGYALGGGLQLALACDIRIATEDCQLGLPAIKEGIVPGLGTFRLPRYVGLGRAKWMVLSGENVDGRRAHEIGLIDHVLKAESFDAGLSSLVEKYSRVCSEGTRQSKMLLNMPFDMTHGQFFEEYLRRQRIALASSDHQEAMSAYREGREPIFST